MAAPAPAPAPPSSSTAPVTRGVVGWIAYGLALPPAYRLVDTADHLRHRWEPMSGSGMTYEVRVRPRAAVHEGNVWKVPACRPEELAGIEAAARGDISGVDRIVSVTVERCLPETTTEPSDRFACEARHARGHLEGTEPDAAVQVCRTLAATRQAR